MPECQLGVALKMSCAFTFRNVALDFSFDVQDMSCLNFIIKFLIQISTMVLIGVEL